MKLSGVKKFYLIPSKSEKKEATRKLKAHEKPTGDRHSRQSKDKKGKKN